MTPPDPTGGAALRHLVAFDDIWAPDLSRRGDAPLRRRIDRDTEDMLRDWRAARDRPA